MTPTKVLLNIVPIICIKSNVPGLKIIKKHVIFHYIFSDLKIPPDSKKKSSLRPASKSLLGRPLKCLAGLFVLLGRTWPNSLHTGRPQIGH